MGIVCSVYQAYVCCVMKCGIGILHVLCIYHVGCVWSREYACEVVSGGLLKVEHY